MVNPTNVALAASIVRGTPVLVGTVIGFPLGANTSATKIAESEDALRLGAQELDMVINVGAEVRRPHAGGHGDQVSGRTGSREWRDLKVIIETALLTTEEKILACQLSVEAGADFVKTSTWIHRGCDGCRRGPDARRGGSQRGSEGRWWHSDGRRSDGDGRGWRESGGCECQRCDCEKRKLWRRRRNSSTRQSAVMRKGFINQLKASLPELVLFSVTSCAVDAAGSLFR